jgi:hypothetical protein
MNADKKLKRFLNREDAKNAKVFNIKENTEDTLLRGVALRSCATTKQSPLSQENHGIRREDHQRIEKTNKRIKTGCITCLVGTPFL